VKPQANCVSEGIHIERCPPDTGGDPPLSHPTKATTTQCLVNSECSSYPKTTPGYDPAFLRDPSTRTLSVDPSFDAALTAAGCSAEQIYNPFRNFPSMLVGYAFCPTMPVTNTALYGELACDACTGAPPDGWTIVAWELEIPSSPEGKTRPWPGSGCAEMECLGALQGPGDYPAPIPPPPPALQTKP
jgi:hypothetical protein